MNRPLLAALISLLAAPASAYVVCVDSPAIKTLEDSRLVKTAYEAGSGVRVCSFTLEGINAAFALADAEGMKNGTDLDHLNSFFLGSAERVELLERVALEDWRPAGDLEAYLQPGEFVAAPKNYYVSAATYLKLKQRSLEVELSRYSSGSASSRF